MIRRLVFASAIFLLGACASGPDGDAEAGGAAVSAASTVGAGATASIPAGPGLALVPRRGLDPQTLGPGDCGMFLWTQTTPRRFVFFARGGSAAARMLVGEETIDLAQTGTGGEIFGQFMTEARYAPRSGAPVVDVAVEPGDLLEDGQRISGGLIRLTDAQGWETILPVVGVRACFPG